MLGHSPVAAAWLRGAPPCSPAAGWSRLTLAWAPAAGQPSAPLPPPWCLLQTHLSAPRQIPSCAPRPTPCRRHAGKTWRRGAGRTWKRCWLTWPRARSRRCGRPSGLSWSASWVGAPPPPLLALLWIARGRAAAVTSAGHVKQRAGWLRACACAACGRVGQTQGNGQIKQEPCFARRAATRALRVPARLGPCPLQRSVGSGAAGSATSGLRCSKRSCRRFACRCGLWPWTERRKALSRSPLTWRHSCCQPG